MMLHLCNAGLVGLHVWEQPLDETIYTNGVCSALQYIQCWKNRLTTLSQILLGITLTAIL